MARFREVTPKPGHAMAIGTTLADGQEIQLNFETADDAAYIRDLLSVMLYEHDRRKAGD